MKAVVQDVYGSADVLQFRDIDPPSVRDSEVLVRVHAAGVDSGTAHLMEGKPYLVRLFGFGVRRPKNPVRGRDVAGRVEAVGDRVTRFAPGDAVFGTCEGAFAEFAAARESRLAAMPAGLTFEAAAAVPISGGTALQAVRDVGKVRPGQRVMVIGAGGGVGTFAVQLAVAAGGGVTGVCSSAKAELVRSLGATDVIDYTTTDLDAGVGGPYDVIIDTAGGRPLRVLRRLLTTRGTLVIVGADNGGPLLGGIDRLLRALLLAPFVSQRLRGMFATEGYQDLEVLSEYLVAGTVRPVVDRTFPLPDAADAVRYLTEGRVRGKVVVVP